MALPVLADMASSIRRTGCDMDRRMLIQVNYGCLSVNLWQHCIQNINFPMSFAWVSSKATKAAVET